MDEEALFSRCVVSPRGIVHIEAWFGFSLGRMRLIGLLYALPDLWRFASPIGFRMRPSPSSPMLLLLVPEVKNYCVETS